MYLFSLGAAQKALRKKILNLLVEKPLIAHSILQALKCEVFDRVFVSTEDKEIAKIASSYGADIIIRPDYLADDEMDALRYAIEHVEESFGSFNRFVSLPPTSPLRNSSDILNAIDLLDSNTSADLCLGICQSSKSPYFNMVIKNEQNYLELACQTNGVINRRQDAPPIFDITTVVYAASTDFIKKNNNIFAGTVIGFEIPKGEPTEFKSIIEIFNLLNFYIIKLVKLNKKSFLVIGGGGLLGSHLTASMLDQGARIIAIDIDLEQMKQKLSLSDVNLTTKKLSLSSIDITDEDAVKKFFSQISIGTNGDCDSLWINYGNSFLNVSQSDFNNNVALHLGSAFLIMRECASYFDKNKHQFSLVNLASIYGSKAPDFTIYEGTNMTMPVEYAAIKSAIIHLNKYVVSFISDSSFRVNSVSPGGLIANQPKEFIDLYKKKTLGKGMLSPDDVIETIIFLLSNASQFINGQDIVVDDGFTL